MEMSQNWRLSRLSINKRKPKKVDTNLKLLKNSSYKNRKNRTSKTEFKEFLEIIFVSGIIKLFKIPRDARLPKMKPKVRSFLWRWNPVDTGRKLNVHKTFRRCPGRLLNVLCTFNLRHVSTGNEPSLRNFPSKIFALKTIAKGPHLDLLVCFWTGR